MKIFYNVFCGSGGTFLERSLYERACITGAAVFEGCGSLYREESCIRGSVGFRVFGHE